MEVVVVERIKLRVLQRERVAPGRRDHDVGRTYYSSEEILACREAGIVVTLPKPMTSGIEARGRFGKQHFVYLSDEDVHRCPTSEKLMYHYTNEEHGRKLRRYWINACHDCVLEPRCTIGKERRITRSVPSR
jgi:hypothetical protein